VTPRIHEIPLEEVTRRAESDRYPYFLPAHVPTEMLLSSGHTFWLTLAEQHTATLIDMAHARQHRASIDRRSTVAGRFIQRIRTIPGVQDVHVALDPELVVTVVTADHDMERDLRLHAMFADEAQDLPGSERLRIRPYRAGEEGQPDTD
jgi:hypothetical protein